MWILTNNRTDEQVKFSKIEEVLNHCDLNKWDSVTIQFKS